MMDINYGQQMQAQINNQIEEQIPNHHQVVVHLSTVQTQQHHNQQQQQHQQHQQHLEQQEQNDVVNLAHHPPVSVVDSQLNGQLQQTAQIQTQHLSNIPMQVSQMNQMSQVPQLTQVTQVPQLQQQIQNADNQLASQKRYRNEDDMVEAVVESMLADDHNSTAQQQAKKQRKYPISGMTSDEVTEARRKMNILLQTQEKAQEELKEAEEHLKISHERVQIATKNIELTSDAVKQGTEELTDALLQEPTHWNAMYRKLIEYKEQHGHVDVKRNPLKSEKESNPDYVKLGSWVGRVRLEARRPVGHPEHIEPYKVIALNRLGFNWDPRENYWMEKFNELKEYMKSHGKHKMPTRKEPLGVWCDGQVLEYNKYNANIKPCYISKERIDMLNKIGFVWDRMGTAWMDSYEELKKYYQTNGHCHVPVNHGDKTLFRWIAKQRKKYKNYEAGKKPALTTDQIKLLENVGFFESSEERLAKFNSQKEKTIKKERRLSSARGKGRGRPKSRSLIPAEVQQAMKMNQNVAIPFVIPTPLIQFQNIDSGLITTTEESQNLSSNGQNGDQLEIKEEQQNDQESQGLLLDSSEKKSEDANIEVANVSDNNEIKELPETQFNDTFSDKRSDIIQFDDSNETHMDTSMKDDEEVLAEGANAYIGECEGNNSSVVYDETVENSIVTENNENDTFTAENENTGNGNLNNESLVRENQNISQDDQSQVISSSSVQV
mmetsp:Transcript_12377/g.17642  ORF Transcript_12377/g.17642 Transcript_12377/m.17642 type:complete len:719 (-) Transcript_12377:53-2209(-)